MDRLRRTRLYVPGNTPDLMINCGLFGADAVILDLEDSVSPPEKDAARYLIRNAIDTLDFGTSELIVRVNPYNSPYGRDDLEVIVPAGPDVILIPKCETAEDVTVVAEAIARLEKATGLSKTIKLMPLIETCKGVMHAYEICRASDRTVAVNFGAEDYTADLGVERTREGKEHLFARQMIVTAAKACGIMALDTVYSDIEDVEGLIAATQESMALGFDGRGIIHPSQIEPIHNVYRPTPERIAYAQKVVAALAEAKAKGLGVAALGSKMIDAPVVARAEKILALAKAVCAIPPEVTQ